MNGQTDHKAEMSRPERPAAGCPVRPECERVVSQGRNTVRALRRLRRSLMRCQRCELYGECPFLLNFQNQVDIAIGEVLEEWAREEVGYGD